ncbi:DUF1311 domain-containing protein [Endozoicomonas sp. SM1973]|uniref:DUF1311 domain-containing protein n=1 Tax=Spartinivicinus marinus TaxID=2994442 RepID=A0A853IGE2_9GAMM|nr:lysozyme inhibitor LprI family protein [Spartinivicinus marinus]MCX4027808.1 lysozyme inhibitor LprI family protein [Spartinivicinus marinus]NYZ69051.1 DUF1311 domain-containing protein [Spartinivicinus marinus]
MLKVLRPCFVLLFFNCSQVYSFNFDYKKINDFKVLSEFSSVDKFESEIAKYIDDYLANTGGGTGGVPCYIGVDLWDRELNIYYKKLNTKLNKKEKKLLKKSQKEWLKTRDATVEFMAEFLGDKYP